MPYISSTAIDNGVDNFVRNHEWVRIFSDCITVANSGSVGASFYQPFQFVASDHVTGLKNKGIDKHAYLFVTILVSRLKEKYSFNREINDQRIQKEKILLPATDSWKPDYECMSARMQEIEISQLQKYLSHKALIS